MTKEKQKILNVPNVLTIIRMLLIPVYWFVFFDGQPGHTYLALGIFIVASLTDLADGHIARKYNLITDFGKLMDPLADKLMVVSVMLSLAIKGWAPWAALIIILCKELLMVLGGALLYKKGVVVYAEKIGKYAQATVVAGLILCFFHEWFMEHVGFPINYIVIWCAVALTLSALFFYARSALKKYREAGAAEKR